MVKLMVTVFLFLIVFTGCTNSDTEDGNELSTDLKLGSAVRLGDLPVEGVEWKVDLYNHGATIYGVISNHYISLHTISSDSGANWSALEVTDKMHVLGVYEKKIYRQKLIDNKLNLYSSEDGVNWMEKTVFTLPDNLNVDSNTQTTGVVADNGTIWCAVYYWLEGVDSNNYTLTILKSTDQGKSFLEKPPEKASDYFRRTFVNMLVQGKHVAVNGTYFYGKHGGESMLISSDYGDSFEEVSSNNFSRAAADPANPVRVYYCRYGENAPYQWSYTFHRTSDFGKTSDITEDCEPCDLVVRSSSLIARLDKNGIRQSKDEGMSWSEYVNVTGNIEVKYTEISFIERVDKKLFFMWINDSSLYIRKEK